MKTRSYLHLVLVALLFLLALPLSAQRKMEKLDRGVVAMPKTSSTMFISWRHLATDPDETSYNLYYKTSAAGSLTKLNGSPITGATNYVASLSTSSAAYTFVVKSLLDGVESDEEGSFTVPRSTVASRLVRDFDFHPLPATGYPSVMTMKYCWPADLDGDGKYDFVLDRHDYNGMSDDEESDTSSSTSYAASLVEAYTSEGKFLWRMSMGYNVQISNGHNDMVTAYDMDGDNKAEVLVIISEGTTFADGTVWTNGKATAGDYTTSVGSAPQWLAVIDGLTGAVRDIVEVPLHSQMATTRSDKWKNRSGHFIISYLDGINPSLIYQVKNRLANGNFQGAHIAWRFVDGKIVEDWAKMFYSAQAGSEFHQVRAADVDGDGCDEFVEGGYVINNDGSLLHKKPGIYHGDRHCLADIDPDRPGLEHFFIQQTNILGMGLADALTGEILKGHYMTSTADIGRGICAAFDPETRGMQYYSTMDNNTMYDCKGNSVGGGMFPAEAMWFGPELSRYQVHGIGNGGYNLAFSGFYKSGSTKGVGRITPNFYNENNGNGTYYFKAANGGRAAFWGDLFGDWREEMICVRSNDTGFVIASTWDVTTHRQYCLMQNPAYLVQTTARGYYQTADVDFYMAADMPAPPIAPVQTADMYYNGSTWSDFATDGAAAFANGKSIMFDIRGDGGNFSLTSNMMPSRLWLMNPKEKDYTFDGTGSFMGDMDVVKSLQGDVTFNGNHDYTGITRISEGRLYVNGTLASKVQVDARGVIGGKATLNGGIALETGLNVEGGRIEPGYHNDLGTLTIVGNLALPGRNTLAFDVDQSTAIKSDLLHIQGDFTVSGSNHTIVINPITGIAPGTLTLVTFTGTTNATAESFAITGLEGIPYDLAVNENSISIIFTEARSASAVTWTGAQSGVWDFRARNFVTNNGAADIFVPGDAITFDDEAVNKTITIEGTMPVASMEFNNETNYTLSGTGIISGEGGIKQTGKGAVSLLGDEHTFTGGVEINGGTLVVSSLKDGGMASSIGASSAAASNWIMRNATLQTAGKMTTNRAIQVEDTLTVNNPTTDHSVLLGGNITGTDITLVSKGRGVLTLQGTNRFTDVTLQAGTLYLGSADANRNSLGSAKVTLSGGTFTMFDINSTSNTGTFTNEVHVPEGATATWNTPSRWNISNKLTGAGTVTVYVPYVRTDFNGNWSEFEGVVKFTGRDVRANSASARSMPKAEVQMDAYLAVASNGSGETSTAQTFTFGALSGSGTINGIHSLSIGARNTSTTFSGTYSAGSGRLTKTGTGTFTIAGEMLHTGGTTLSGGAINLTGKLSTGAISVANGTSLTIAAGASTGAGTITVASGGTFTITGTGTTAKNVTNNGEVKGTGTISGNLTANAESTITPGATVNGTLRVGGNATLRANAKLAIRAAGAANRSDKLEVTGTLNLTDAILEVTNYRTNPFELGNRFTLFSAATIEGEFAEVILPELEAGLLWDTSLLYTDGVLEVVADPTAIDDTAVTPAGLKENPTQGLFEVVLAQPVEAIQVRVVDMTGRVVYAAVENGATGVVTIDITTHSDGLYLLNMKAHGKSFEVLRLIKQ